MQSRFSKEAILIVLFPAMLVLSGCSSFRTFVTDSAVPERPIAIDGMTEDWAGRLLYIADEPISLGFLNDKDDLYICLLVEDFALRTLIQRLGLTIWIDPQGGTKREFGIRYPLGTTARAMSGMPRMDFPPDPEDMPSETVPAEIGFIRSAKEEPQIVPLSEVKGVELKLAPSSGRLVYEIRIPLARTEAHPWAVGAAAGQTIGLGFETGTFESPGMPGAGPGGMGGGRRPPMGGPPGGGPGMGGGRGSGPRSEMPRGIKLWATVRLAPDESAGKAGIVALMHGLGSKCDF